MFKSSFVDIVVVLLTSSHIRLLIFWTQKRIQMATNVVLVLLLWVVLIRLAIY